MTKSDAHEYENKTSGNKHVMAKSPMTGNPTPETVRRQ